MNKVWICCICLLILVLWGCRRHESSLTQWCKGNGRLKVLSTTAMIHDLVKEIGGDDIDAIALIQGELDPHSYEIVKGDDEKFARADLIFYNGLGLEHGLSLRQNLINNPKAIAVANTILDEDAGLILKVDGQYDPHVWMDIALWMKTVEPIVDALCQKDSAHANVYRERGALLQKKLTEADLEAFRLLQSLPARQRYLVTSHDAFHYFARHYLAEPGEENWQMRCQAPEGLAPEAQMSVTDVIAVVSHIEFFGIPVLFPESNVSRDSLHKIMDAAREKGFRIRLCQKPLYGDSMGKAASYLEMILHNVNVIADELGSG
jgi:manganese/zinc/iron transport system substrate-binding protein